MTIMFSRPLLFLLLCAFLPPQSTPFLRGTPGSSEFGYGAQVYPGEKWLEESLNLSNNMQLDWIALTVDWQTMVDTPNQQIDWSSIDHILDFSTQYQIGVLLSLTNAPSWALTPQGPDPEKTIDFLQKVISRKPNATLIIELFPGANTQSGWKSDPNPEAYANLYKQVTEAFQKNQFSSLLAAGGLIPQNDSQEGMDDLKFLQRLYDAGIGNQMGILTLQANTLTSSPLDPPSPNNHKVLRHYEQVRAVMSQNQATNGLLWLTKFGPPSGMNWDQQREWLIQAYRQIRSQLYIGSVILNGLNVPNSSAEAANSISLIESSDSYHPFYALLRDMISANAPTSMLSQRGRIKEQDIIKSR
jgi:hypothetical protein